MYSVISLFWEERHVTGHFPTFRDNILNSYSRFVLYANSEYDPAILPSTVTRPSPSDTAPNPKKTETSTTSLRKSKNSHSLFYEH